jgi:hypothetical protein
MRTKSSSWPAATEKVQTLRHGTSAATARIGLKRIIMNRARRPAPVSFATNAKHYAKAGIASNKHHHNSDILS